MCSLGLHFLLRSSVRDKFTCCPWSQKSFILMWRCHQLLSGFLAKVYLPPESRQSNLSANDKDDNVMILGAVHRSPDICLTAEENSRKPQLGDRRWRLWDQSSPQITQKKVGRITQRQEGRSLCLYWMQRSSIVRYLSSQYSSVSPFCTIILWIPSIQVSFGLFSYFRILGCNLIIFSSIRWTYPYHFVSFWWLWQ